MLYFIILLVGIILYKIARNIQWEEYLRRKNLYVDSFSRGFAWLDTGTPDSLLSANNFIGTIEKRQGLKVACLEEIAFNNKWINSSKLNKLKDKISNGPYKDYLRKILKK